MTTQTGRPHVLITNDDGIEAPGIAALAEALRPEADLTIVAPARENSGMGHAITVLRDLRFEPFHRDGMLWGYGLEGTPADCVKIAVQVLAADRPFDLVVSGINAGQNCGINILYSGTVAAAREAAVLGLPAFAVSLLYHDAGDLYFDTAGRVALDVMRMVRRRGLPRGVMLNVNVPPLPYESIKGWVVTRMGESGYADLFLHEPGQADEPAIYRNVGKGFEPSTIVHGDAARPLDDIALYEDNVSITPLMFDLTAHDFLGEVDGWMPHGEKMMNDE
ncbi:5'/3'-nucleotidase SurE [bacterium]|nr:5'/3'-nucleotidase SurE [bacterium]